MSQGVKDADNIDPKYHGEPRDGCLKVRFLKCPFCADNKDYGYNDLLRHVNWIVSESETASFKEKAEHMGLVEYLERDFQAKIKCFDSTSVNLTPNQNANEELLVWPWMAVVANIPVEYENYVGTKLKYDWIKEGYSPVRVHLLLKSQSLSGHAVVEFGKTRDGFFHVMEFMKAFEVNKHGRKDWFDRETCKDNKLYGWIEPEQDTFN